jgi:hypothetical protein
MAWHLRLSLVMAWRVLGVAVLLLIGWTLHGYADSQRVAIKGRLLATEAEADAGTYHLTDEGNTPVCADPDSYLDMYLRGTVGHEITVTYEANSSNSTH